MTPARRDLPSGTVTFLFTDIEGSTKLLHQLGPDAYGEALAEHRRLLRQAFDRHGGVEVDTQGDAFFVSFPTAAGAVRAAREAADALAPTSIRVRMGLHTGTPHVGGEGYIGEDVHKGARIAAAGHGGQILVSKETRQLVDVEVTDLGEHRLKDLEAPVWIYQLGAERFPPLKTISNTNLPRPASSFVGRQREVVEIASLLRSGARIVTLTGPGGSGKTRLAIEVGTDLLSDHRNGVFWIALATVADPSLVPETIAKTLGAQDDLTEHIGEREMLLVLDNLEQVVEAAPELSRLMTACPNLRLLATSRELLRIDGEVGYEVLPLAEPDAIELFSARSGLRPDATIAELCRQLDSLPLAIELAAARAGMLTPAQILDRLSDRLDLFTGRRDADARQRTLRATIAWSHDLLDDPERSLFARLAVFAGGCTLEDAEAVADADLDTLQSLVEKSLVRRTGGRVWMLETIRGFALERFDASDDREATARRHATRYLALVEEAEPRIVEGSDEWLDRLEDEIDNIRVALDRLHTWGETELEARLAGAAAEFWCQRYHIAEGRRHLERALARDAPPTSWRAKALVGAAHMARDVGESEIARARAEEALELSRDLEDPQGVAFARFWLAQALADAGEFAAAKTMHEENVRVFAEIGLERESSVSTRMLAWMHAELGERDIARALHEQNLERIRDIGDRALEASTLGALASYAVEDRRVADALSLSRAALRLEVAAGDRLGVAHQLCRAAGAHAIAGQAEIAATLLGCSEALHEELGVRLFPYLVRENDLTVAIIHEALEGESFAATWELGRRMSVDDAVALALGDAS